jgi:hypothetical protein
MRGLIRIPKSLPSNYDTGKGMTAVDLINVGDKTKGYAKNCCSGVGLRRWLEVSFLGF